MRRKGCALCEPVISDNSPCRPPALITSSSNSVLQETFLNERERLITALLIIEGNQGEGSEEGLCDSLSRETGSPYTFAAFTFIIHREKFHHCAVEEGRVWAAAFSLS